MGDLDPTRFNQQPKPLDDTPAYITDGTIPQAFVVYIEGREPAYCSCPKCLIERKANEQAP